jgi:Rod binding domain-containing protein
MIDKIDVPAPLLAENGPRPAKDLKETARDFESLLIAQMLRSVREAGGASGWLGSGEDSTAASAMEMAEEQFAAALAQQGGLGLASMVVRGLEAQSGDPSSEPAR